MSIFLYAFLTLTFLNAFKDITIKKSLKDLSPNMLTGITAIVMILVSLPFVIRDGIPAHLDLSLLLVIAGGGIFYYFGKYFNFTALSLGDISVIAPMKGLVSVFVIFSSILLLGESVSLGGGIGILLIVGGTYFLAIEKSHTHFLSPIRALWQNPGSRMFLIATVFYAFTVTFDRMGIQKSSVWIWTLAMNSIMLIMSLPDFYREKDTVIPRIGKYWKILLIIVCLHAIVYLSQMYVVAQIIAPYTTAFKSASSLFAVIIGGWFFQEQNLMRRFFGALIIFSGILAIVFVG